MVVAVGGGLSSPWSVDCTLSSSVLGRGGHSTGRPAKEEEYTINQSCDVRKKLSVGEVKTE